MKRNFSLFAFWQVGYLKPFRDKNKGDRKFQKKRNIPVLPLFINLEAWKLAQYMCYTEPDNPIKQVGPILRTKKYI